MFESDDSFTLYGGIFNNVDSGDKNSLVGFLTALGQGLKKVASLGWGAAQIIGSEPDDLFPDAYEENRDAFPLKILDVFDHAPARKHVFENRKNQVIMNKLAEGDALHDNEIAQVDLIHQLLKKYAQKPEDHTAANAFHSRALQAIVGSHLASLPVQNDQVNYRGQWISRYQAPGLVKADTHRLITTGERMSLPEIREWHETQFTHFRQANLIVSGGERPFIALQPVPINPIPPQTKRLFEGEHDVGPRSDESKFPPISINRMDAKTAYNAFYSGEGQSYIVPFSSIRFELGRFRVDGQFMKEVVKLAEQAKEKRKPITKLLYLEKQAYEFKNENTDEAWVYGNLLIDLKGELSVDLNGNWWFNGAFLPNLGEDDRTGEIYRGDRFNFNPSPGGHRSPKAELAVQFFHHTPGTSYKIYFKNMPANVTLSNRIR